MPWATHSLSALRQDLATRYESVPFWTPDEATAAINEGFAFWNLLTGYWRARVTLDATPGSPSMVLPSTLVFGTRLTYLSQPLAKGSLADLFRGRPNWWTETTADGGDVPIRPTVWAPISLQLIVVWPQPAAFLANAFTADGVAATPVLVAEDATVELEEGVLDALLGYALHALAFKEGWSRLAGTIPQFRAFLSLAAEENSQLKASGLLKGYLGGDRQKDLVPTRGVPESLTRTVSQGGGFGE